MPGSLFCGAGYFRYWNYKFVCGSPRAHASPGRPIVRWFRRVSDGSDEAVDADLAAGATGLADAVQRVLGGLHAGVGVLHQRLVVRVVGRQAAGARLVDQVFDTLCQGNHSSVVRTGKPENPPLGYADTIVIEAAVSVKGS